MNRRSLVGLGSAFAFSGRTSSSARTQTESTLEKLLKQVLWTERDSYDACHYLMVPMHAAFRNPGEATHAEQFIAFMDRFTAAWARGDFGEIGLLNRFQYLALVSRYLRIGPGNDQLLDLMVSEHKRLYLETPLPHWTKGEFPTVRESIEWKLSDPDTERDYYTAILDTERFCLMIGADLLACVGTGAPDHLVDARDLGVDMLRKRSYWGVNGEWMVDVGELWDHPDQAYAGYLEPSDNMEPKPIPGLAKDSSHAHRLPVFLDAFLPAEDADLRDEIISMREGLAKQLLDHCMVQPDESFRSIRLTNYLDGHNGLYRWGHATQGENNGYRPYELSGTFNLGWWSLLYNEEIHAAYQVAADCLPLTQQEIDLYVGPNSTRESNPLFILPNAYVPGGMMETCIRSALLI